MKMCWQRRKERKQDSDGYVDTDLDGADNGKESTIVYELPNTGMKGRRMKFRGQTFLCVWKREKCTKLRIKVYVIWHYLVLFGISDQTPTTK